MEKAQTSEIKNGLYFHWAERKIERPHIFCWWCLCENVTTGTLIGKEDGASVWNKFKDGCGAGMGRAERPSHWPWSRESPVQTGRGSLNAVVALGHFLSYQSKSKSRVSNEFVVTHRLCVPLYILACSRKPSHFLCFVHHGLHSPRSLCVLSLQILLLCPVIWVESIFNPKGFQNMGV